MIFFREYLALFKKTVAMHEVFLQRLSAHPTFRQDYNFQTFLEFEADVSQFILFVQYLHVTIVTSTN